jgi:hypothetical protein
VNANEAKAICPDFTPVDKSDGTVGCRHILAGDTCRLPSHFVCELVAHRNREDAKLTKIGINSAMKKVRLKTISASRIGVLQQCPRLYQLRYVYRLKSPIDQAWKRTGSAFGDERAKIEQGLHWSLDGYNLSAAEKARLSAVLRRYAEFKRAEELVSEVQCKFEYKGFEFIGYVDSETYDGKRIYEWKYAVGTYGPLKLARQAAVYFMGRPETEEFIHARAKKPQHKPKKAAKQKKTPKPTKKNPNPEPYPVPQAETMAEFEERVYGEIDSEWFTYRVFKRSDIDIEGILDQMVAAAKNQESLEDLGYPPNFNIRCDDCEFFGLCDDHISTDIGCDKKFCSTAGLCTDIRAARQRLSAPADPKKLPMEGTDE